MRRLGGIVAGLCVAVLTSWSADAQEVRTTITGVVYDSVARRHLDSAIVQLVRADRPGDARTTFTDREGRYRFEGIGAGNWILGFIHQGLDSLGIPSPLLHVRVEDPAPIRAMLAVPPPATIVREVCGSPPTDSGGLWYGHARSAVTGEVLPNATVYTQWSRIRLIGKSIERDIPELAVRTGEDGSFRQCMMPLDEIVAARAWRDADTSGVVTFTMPAQGLLRRDIFVAPVQVAETRIPPDSGHADSALTLPVRVGTGRVLGRVMRPGGEAVRGARLRFIDTGAEAVSNDKGYFGFDSLPLGSSSLDARAIGYVSAVRAVDVMAERPTTVDIVLDNRKDFLDTVKVIGRRIVIDTPRYQEFMQRRRMGIGHFFDEADLVKRQLFFVSDALRLTPGVRIMPGGRVLFAAYGAMASYCAPAIFLDGLRLAGQERIGLDALVNVEDVRAMEVYTRDAQVPSEFRGPPGCGSIVVWTGGRTRRQLQ